ncbi:MAG: glycosyltransferase family 39 protein [Candidatus Kapabacteria bacterium]|nr:glycosyltransferase family 39 protein [Candidatus Kapabacteria bacterium]
MKINRIYILIFVLVTLFTLVPRFYNLKFSDDSVLYDGIAKALINGESKISTPGYFEDGSDIGQTILPGYPAFIAVIYKIFGTKAVNVIVFQLFLSFCAIWVYFLISKEMFSRNKAIAFTLLYVFYVNQWSYSLLLLIESITISTLVFSLYFLFKYFITNSNKYLYYYALIFGLLISLNNRFIFHFVFVGFYLVIINLNKKYIHNLKNIIFAALIVITLLLPWHIRQYNVYGRFVLFTPERTANMSNKNISTGYSEKKAAYDYVPGYDTVINLYMTQYLTKEYRKETKAEIERKFNIDKYQELKSSYTAFSPSGKILSRAKGFWEIVRFDYRFGFAGDMRVMEPSFYDKFTSPLFLMDFADLFFLGLAFLGILPALFFAIKNKNHFFLILGIYILAHWILHSYVGYLPRYRITIMPVIFLLGSYGINEIYIKIKNKKLI